MSKRINATYYKAGEPYLLSGGRYKTKLTPQDLPPWYIEGLYYGYEKGYMRAKGVSYLMYKPNLFSNHMFKDDFLLILYQDVTAKPILAFEQPCHEYIWGWNIPRFLAAAKRFSGCDTTAIEKRIIAKADWYLGTYPDDAARELGGRSMSDILNELKDTV